MPRRIPPWIRRHRVELSFWGVVGLSFALVLILSWNISENRKLGHLGKEAHDSLCVFKSDLRRRVADTNETIVATKKLLDENKGATIFGFPRDVIEQSLAARQATISGQRSALRSLPLDCTPPPETVAGVTITTTRNPAP